jgi:hypothetical protein
MVTWTTSESTTVDKMPDAIGKAIDLLNVVGVDRALDTVVGVVTITGSASVSASFDGKSDKVNFKISDNATKCRSGTH